MIGDLLKQVIRMSGTVDGHADTSCLHPETAGCGIRPGFSLSLCQTAVFLFLWYLCAGAANTVEANEITGISASQNRDFTRIVIELSDVPHYSYSSGANGLEYTVRIHDIESPKKKYGMATITRNSVLSSVKKGSGKNEVFYVLTLKQPVVPKFTAYRAAQGRNAKLVMEFPQTLNSSGGNQKTAVSQISGRKVENGTSTGASKVTSSGNSQRNRLSGSHEPAVPVINTPAKVENVSGLSASGNKKTATGTVSSGKTSTGGGRVSGDRKLDELEAALFDTLNEASDNNDPTETLEQRLSTPEPPKPAHSTRKDKNTCVVVVDPGHGGKDPGAIGGKGTYEKSVTLGISRYLIEYLDGDKTLSGYLTRSGDRFIDLGERSKIARKRKADMLISIHADSAYNTEANGASVLVLSKDRADRENDKITAGDQKKLIGGAGDAINHMCGENKYLKDCSFVVDLASSSSMNYGFELANKLLSRLKRVTRLHKKTPISRSLAVLKAPDIPSLLVETGYLSNPDEEKLLATDKYRRRLAYAIYLGIKDFVEANPSVCLNTSSSITPIASGGTKRSNRSAAGSKQPVYHVVKKGEYLAGIARKYGVTMEHIRNLNNLKQSQVNVGQRLRIK